MGHRRIGAVLSLLECCCCGDAYLVSYATSLGFPGCINQEGNANRVGIARAAIIEDMGATVYKPWWL